MVDISRIVSVVEIRGVRLREASCRSLVRPSELPEAMNVATSCDAKAGKVPPEDGALYIAVNFGLEVHGEDAEESLVAEVRGTFELSYQLPEGEVFSAEELEAFAGVNAVFNAWPYWRELVQTTLARMSLPVLTVPVFRVPKPDSRDASERNGDG
ncbi:MAG: hypothetical protein OXE58_00580 [Acidobacteria bacterium]|nr:hypothetical protein [Acidobacteriota bacterium]